MELKLFTVVVNYRFFFTLKTHLTRYITVILYYEAREKYVIYVYKNKQFLIHIYSNFLYIQ